MQRRFLAAAAVAALAFGVVPAGAQNLSGSQLNFTGIADATELGAAGVRLAFSPSTIVGGTGNTGSFAQLGGISGALGTIRDFAVGAGPSAIPGFVTFGG